MRNTIIVTLAAVAMLASCADGGNRNSQSINTKNVETSATPTHDEVSMLWTDYMNDKLNIPSEMATIDIDHDGQMEYIYAKRSQQMMLICTFNPKDRLRLAAASCHEEKKFFICDGAGTSESIETNGYQESRYAALEGSSLLGVYYEILSKEGSGPGKWQFSQEPRGIRKDISHAEFETQTAKFNSPQVIPFDNLQWQEYKQ